MPLNSDELRAIADAGRRNGWTPEDLANAVGLDPDRVESWTLEGIIDQAEREGDDPGWIFELLNTPRQSNPIAMDRPLVAALVVGGGTLLVAGIAYAFVQHANATNPAWSPLPPQTPLQTNRVYRFSDLAQTTDVYTLAQMQELFGSDFRIGDVQRSPPPSGWIDDGGTRIYVEFTVARDGVTIPAGASPEARLYIAPPGFV